MTDDHGQLIVDPIFSRHRGRLFRRAGVKLRMFHALQVYISYMFHLDIACVLFRFIKVDLALHMLNCYTRMLQVYISNILAVLEVCCKCFIWIFICCSGYTYMLHE
jgi:hypothetical protein